MASDPLGAIQIVGSIILAVGGIWLLTLGRKEHPPGWCALPGAGQLSSVTLTVCGLSGVYVAYHLFVYAAHITSFRGPLWSAAVIGIGAPGLSMLIDLLEHRADRNGDQSGDDSGR